MMENIITDIIIGVAGSIVATILLFVLKMLYVPYAKSQIAFNLNFMENLIYRIEMHLGFEEDFEIIMHCIEELYKLTFDTAKHIYPLTLFPKHKIKQIIFTLLYDLSCRCEYILSIVHGSEKEIEGRFYLIHKRLYNAGERLQSSMIMDQVKIIKELFANQTLKAAFQSVENWKIYKDDYDFLINVNSFKRAQKNYTIMDRGITAEEFEKIFSKIKR